MTFSHAISGLALLLVCAVPLSAETYSGQLKLVEDPLTWVVLETKSAEYKVRPNSATFSELRALALKKSRVTVEGDVSGAYIVADSFVLQAPELEGTLALLVEPLTQVVFTTKSGSYTIRPNSPHFGALRKLALTKSRLKIVGVPTGDYLDVQDFTVAQAKLVGRLELKEEPLTQVVFVTKDSRYTVRPNTHLFGKLRQLGRVNARVEVVGVPAGTYLDVTHVEVLQHGTNGVVDVLGQD